MYFTTAAGLGSVIEQPGETFDPTDSSTYAVTSTAVRVPESDISTCLAELGNGIYIGGIGPYIYIWDKVSIGFNQIITLPESWTTHIVGTDQNVFAFTGNRGRIYITNGSANDLFKKFPDYLTGITNPYIQFTEASYSRGQINFAVQARNNANTALTTVNGAWSIDIETKALRLINKVTNTGYSGTTNMIVEMPRVSPLGFNQPPGTGLVIGWQISTSSYGIDRALGTPYTGGESYIDTDMIPIGTYLSPFTGSQLEWKTSVPIGLNGTSETISVYYRTNLNESFTLIGTSTSSDGTISGMPAVSDLFKVNFEKVQWAQFRVVLTSNATTPTFNRLTELRIRDFPSTIK